jgi:hypothetical protein
MDSLKRYPFDQLSDKEPQKHTSLSIGDDILHNCYQGLRKRSS